MPRIAQGFREPVDLLIGVKRRGRDPQPLRSSGNGGIVDRLDINPRLRQQLVADRFALFGISD